MSKKNLSRAVGVVIAAIGILLVALNGFLAARKGKFYGFASILGPLGLAYGFSVILRPPPRMPQTELQTIHKAFPLLGFLLGLACFLALKFVDVNKLFNG